MNETLTHNYEDVLLHFFSRDPFFELSEHLIDVGCEVAEAVRQGDSPSALLGAFEEQHPTIRVQVTRTSTTPATN